MAAFLIKTSATPGGWLFTTANTLLAEQLVRHSFRYGLCRLGYLQKQNRIWRHESIYRPGSEQYDKPVGTRLDRGHSPWEDMELAFIGKKTDHWTNRAGSEVFCGPTAVCVRRVQGAMETGRSYSVGRISRRLVLRMLEALVSDTAALTRILGIPGKADRPADGRASCIGLERIGQKNGCSPAVKNSTS